MSSFRFSLNEGTKRLLFSHHRVNHHYFDLTFLDFRIVDELYLEHFCSLDSSFAKAFPLTWSQKQPFVEFSRPNRQMQSFILPLRYRFSEVPLKFHWVCSKLDWYPMLNDGAFSSLGWKFMKFICGSFWWVFDGFWLSLWQICKPSLIIVYTVDLL